MKYPDFKKAANRHLQTCFELLERIDDGNNDKNKELLLNVYYISGYIAECSLKYVYFSSINFPFNDDVDKKNSSIDYNPKNIRIHKLVDLTQFICVNNTSLVNVEKEFQETYLYINWTPEIRYSQSYMKNESELNKQIITDYLEKVKTFSHTFISLYASNN